MRIPRARWFVYVDWTTEEIPRAYYVGKGLRRRVGQRERSALHRRHVEAYGFRREVVAGPMLEKDAFLEEVKLVRLHGTFFYANRKKWGANLTPGGPCRRRPRRVHPTGLVGRQIGMHYKRLAELRK